MKKLIITVSVGLFILTSCGGNNDTLNETKTRIPKTEIQSKKVEEPVKIESSTGSVEINTSGATVNSSGELSDSGSEEALQEIDKIIDDIAKEK